MSFVIRAVVLVRRWVGIGVNWLVRERENRNKSEIEWYLGGFRVVGGGGLQWSQVFRK